MSAITGHVTSAGYRYPVFCLSCREFIANEAKELSSFLGVSHLSACSARDPLLTVPMWSIGWPYYWDVQNGKVAQDAFTYEVGWLTPTKYVKYGPPQFQSGMDAKEYYRFPDHVQATLLAAEVPA